MVYRIWLRPHHLPFLALYGHIKQNPVNRELFFRVYGEETVKNLDDFFMQIDSNRQGFEVTVVEGVDDVCNLCCYKSNCEIGDYSVPLSAAKKASLEVLKEDISDKNPKKSDDYILRRNPWIQLGERYTIDEILSKLRR